MSSRFRLKIAYYNAKTGCFPSLHSITHDKSQHLQSADRTTKVSTSSINLLKITVQQTDAFRRQGDDLQADVEVLRVNTMEDI